MFCDADFAGDKAACKSTTGVLLAIIGPSTFIPVATISRKQSAVSLSTCESEIIAMITGLRDEALPILDLWEALPSDGKLSSDLIIFEDNQSTILVAEKGYSKQLRHLGRTHRVSLAWLSDSLIANNGRIIYCPTELQAADLYTKAFSNVLKFNMLLQLNGVYSPADQSCVRKLTASQYNLQSRPIPVCIALAHTQHKPFQSQGTQDNTLQSIAIWPEVFRLIQRICKLSQWSRDSAFPHYPCQQTERSKAEGNLRPLLSQM